jgi:integrase/recombinase XerD
MNNLDKFEEYLSINVGKKATSNYYLQMKGFFLHYPEFNQENINQYLASKINTWKSGGSFNAFFKSCKWYMKFAKIEVELPKTKKVENKPRKYLQEKDVEDILNKVPLLFKDGYKAQLVLELLFMSGLRPNELFTLKRCNVNLDQTKIALVDTKTFRSRIVPIPKKLANDIKNYFNMEVEQSNAFNLTPTTIAHYCRTISKHMNLEINPYMWRHNMAHNFLKKTNNLVALSKMLGHTSIKTTQIYCDIDEKELQNIYDKAFNKRK